MAIVWGSRRRIHTRGLRAADSLAPFLEQEQHGPERHEQEPVSESERREAEDGRERVDAPIERASSRTRAGT
jgi:hypothetical protein